MNNTIPIVDTSRSFNFIYLFLEPCLIECFKHEGYQIFSFKNDTLIGVLEGPPQTPFENGYYLFKIIISSEYPNEPSEFIFISNFFILIFLKMDLFQLIF